MIARLTATLIGLFGTALLAGGVWLTRHDLLNGHGGTNGVALATFGVVFLGLLIRGYFDGRASRKRRPTS